MTPGIHTIAAEVYHSAAGISNSMLKWIGHPKTPLHYWAKWIAKLIPDEESDALVLGSLTHRCVLEPETMAGAFHVKPAGMKFSTKDGIAWQSEHQDRPIISAEQEKAITAMRDSVWRHPVASRILKHSDFERSAFADNRGQLLKSRFDAVPRGVKFVADLKTCEAADRDSVERSISKYGYYRQAAFYLKVANLLGLDRSDFVFIFVEKTPPFATAVYQLDPLVIEAGERVIERDLALIRQCEAKNHWPGYSDEIEAAGLPEWEMKRLEKEMA